MLNKRNIASVYARLLLVTKAWKTRRKIVVIESDDWGSIRTSNKEALQYLMGKDYNVSNSPYSYDALETNEDLECLFDLLGRHTGLDGAPTCFTANVLLANPDFKKIKEGNFQKYFFETVEQTAKNNPQSDRLIELWKEGLDKKIFIPQVHAREHVKFWTWLNDLKCSSNEALETFNLNMCGVPYAVSKEQKSYFSPVYVDDSNYLKQDFSQKEIIDDAFKLFEELFGFKSESTIAPNCGWTSSTEKLWKTNTVKYIQGGYLQEHHNLNTVKYIPHFTGEQSKNGLRYLVRNCTFEPVKSADPEYWKSTFKQVDRAFKLNTPAIISTHRVNYSGSIKESNRENSLNQLNFLLEEIVSEYPDVEFLSSVELGNILEYNYKGQP